MKKIYYFIDIYRKQNAFRLPTGGLLNLQSNVSSCKMAKDTVVPQQPLNSPELRPAAPWIHLTIAKWSSTGPLDLLEQSFPIPWSTTLVTMEDLVLTDHPTTNFSCCTHAKSLISHIALFHHLFYFFIYIRCFTALFNSSFSSFASPSCLHNLFPWPFSDKNYFFFVTSSLTKIYHINMRKEKTWLMLTSVYIFTVLPHLFSS